MIANETKMCVNVDFGSICVISSCAEKTSESVQVSKSSIPSCMMSMRVRASTHIAINNPRLQARPPFTLAPRFQVLQHSRTHVCASDFQISPLLLRYAVV